MKLKRNYLNIIMAVLVVFFISCENEDEGQEVTVNPLSVSFTTSSVFLEVSTTNTSMNARTYAWDFGVDGTDDDTSIEFAPSYTYEVGGTYTITLVSRGDNGQEETFSTDVTVSRESINPMAAFTTEQSFLEVTFKDESVNAISYAWDFGDGSGTSTEANPVYTYTAAGTYTVSLTVTSETGDTNAVTSDITVMEAPEAPVADFTFTAADLMVTFTDATVENDANITAYAWDFGDGMGTSTDQNPSYSYAAAGTFDVTLTITFDEINGETTASTTQSVTVTAGGGMTGSGKAAVIRDTDGGDTGELRLNIDPLLSGRLEVTFTRALEIVDTVGGSDKDAFIALLNSTGSTSSERAILDLRIRDDEFSARDQSFTVTSVVPTPGVLQTAVITWTAPDANTPPTVNVTIDGVAITDMPFTSGANAIGGVERVQFRLADNGSVLSNDATFTIEEMEVFSDVGGTTSVFATDFSEFMVGETLDGTDDPFNSSSSEAVVESTGGSSAPVQGAIIRDTDSGDTGELRLNIDPLLSGRLEVTFTRALEIVDTVGGSDKDAFIALLNSTGSTSSERAILDLRIRDDEFSARDQSFTVTSVVPTPGTLQTAIITWTAPDANTPPTVNVTIDGVAITAMPFTSGMNAIGGVERVQFRLADNGSVLSNDATFTIESMEVFSDTAGSTSVFATDFSEFMVGEALDGTDDPFNSSSSEAVVEIIQ